MRLFRCHRITSVMFVMAVAPLLSGCGSTRWTDTPRAATEELLISDAIDRSVEMIDFSPLCGRRVFVDTQYVDVKAETGYLVSSLRQHIAAAGCFLASSKDDAELVVEARVGSLSTNRHDSLLGLPATAAPMFLTGVPMVTPELAVSKKTIQTGVSKLAVFAWWTQDGSIAWQSGVAREDSIIKNSWMLGLGPYTDGASTVRGQESAVAPNVPLLTDLASTHQNALPERPPSSLTYPAIYNLSPPLAPLLPELPPEPEPESSLDSDE